MRSDRRRSVNQWRGGFRRQEHTAEHDMRNRKTGTAHGNLLCGSPACARKCIHAEGPERCKATSVLETRRIAPGTPRSGIELLVTDAEVCGESSGTIVRWRR